MIVATKENNQSHIKFQFVVDSMRQSKVDSTSEYLNGSNWRREFLMKMKTMMKATVVFAALLTFAASSAYALTDAQLASVKKAYNKVPATEMAAKAANMVKQTSTADREAMAVALTRAAIVKNANVASSVVSAISAAAPETSPAVSAAAAEMLNERASTIAMAAAAAAPEYSTRITQSVSTAVPSAATQIAAMPRTRSNGNSGAVTTGGTITITPGPIRGIQYTPVIPPASTPSALVQPGYDPKRYSSPSGN
jgi:hypothetical protein